MPSTFELPPVIDVIRHQLHNAATHEALCCREQSVDSQQLAAAAARLAAALRRHGVSQGMVVAVCFSRSTDLVALLLALWYCGAVYLPLDADWPMQRLRAVLELAGPGVLLHQTEFDALAAALPLPALRIERICFDNVGAPNSLATDHVPAVVLAADDPAYLLFTSGSSGIPKGVLVSHGNLANLFHGSLPQLGLQPGWRYLCCSALGFDLVFFELLAPLFTGGTLVMADDHEYRSPAALCGLVARHGIDVVQATPSLWQLLLLEGLGTTRRLPLALSCGEALPRATAQRLLEHCSNVWNLYGPTETTLWASALHLGLQDLRTSSAVISIGKPLPGYRFELLGNPQAECSELLIGGKGVALGYLGADAAQADSFTTDANDEPRFHSGDCCSCDSLGRYQFHHRIDTQLKINGYRIEAGEIEAVLERMPEVEQACCLAETCDDGSARLLAFVVCGKGMPNRNRESWNRHLAAWLPNWMLPHRYLVIDTLPLTASGKRDRKALLALASVQVPCRDAGGTDTEGQVSALFCAILGVDGITACESFFDAGGSSLLAATLLLALNQHFDTQLRLAELLATPPTVRSVCQLLERSRQA